MKLLEFIELELKAERLKMSISAADKADDCIRALRAFTPAGDCDLRDAVFFDFLYEFGRFLTAEFPKKYSPSTASECLRTLRKYLRVAISRGFVPNIDMVPQVIERLETDCWHIAEKNTSQTYSLLKLKTNESVATLARKIDAWHTKREMDAVSSSDRREREEALTLRCVAIYLFCLMNYGIEIEEAIRITRNIESDNLYIEKEGMKLPVNQDSLRLVAVYNDRASTREHLFSILDNKKYKGDAPKAASLVSKRVASYLSSRGMSLFAHNSVFIDWVNLAIEKGLPINDAEQMWKSRRGKIPASEAAGAMIKAQNLCSSKPSGLTEKWYLLNVFSPSIKRDRFIQLFVASGIMGSEVEATKRIYAPRENLMDQAKQTPSILSRYVFFRATPAQAQYANIFSPYAYVVKGRDRGVFAEVKEREIEELQIMFRDFPDAVELIDGDKWLQEHNAEIVAGSKAIIRSGSLAGKEATIVRVKGRDTQSPTFLLEYVQGMITFQTNLPGLALEIVNG